MQQQHWQQHSQPSLPLLLLLAHLLLLPGWHPHTRVTAEQ
jgi:hypothetical protein